MIIKGIVEEYTDRDNIKVRIPQLHGVEGDSTSVKNGNLPNATLCTLPNCEIKLSSGDVVYVEFENLEWGKPVIVGFLDIKANSKIMLNVTELTVEDKVSLPHNTSIGNVQADSLNCLTGLSTNVQEYINNTSPVVILDLTEYDVGDEVPFSLINSIPEGAMIFAKKTDEFKNIRYYPLIEKSQIGSIDGEEISKMENIPRFNYYFGNMLGVISIINGVIGS